MTIAKAVVAAVVLQQLLASTRRQSLPWAAETLVSPVEQSGKGLERAAEGNHAERASHDSHIAAQH